MKKKIISLFLVAILLFTAACTGKSSDEQQNTEAYVEYTFKSEKLLNQHFEKHGIDMGFANAKDYEKAASDVINNPDALTKTEKEDGDYVFYIESTNEFGLNEKLNSIKSIEVQLKCRFYRFFIHF